MARASSVKEISGLNLPTLLILWWCDCCFCLQKGGGECGQITKKSFLIREDQLKKRYGPEAGQGSWHVNKSWRVRPCPFES